MQVSSLNDRASVDWWDLEEPTLSICLLFLKNILNMADPMSIIENLTDLDSLHSRAGRVDEGSVGDMAKHRNEAGCDDQVDSITKRLNTMNATMESTFADEVSSFEDEFVEIGGHPEHNYFDGVVGAIEDIVMGEDFHEVQSSYLDKYWPEFSEDQTENLHSHFEMFKEYSQGISSFIEEKLKTLLEHFDMEVFVEQLTARGELDGDIFDMLFTLIDFVKFKELLLDYRAMREGKTIDLSHGISIKALQPDTPTNI
ncbi:unnamed protein product [Allacma fusca]|uniref:ADP-ribosylation factor-like protein 2-binding protein n=1 Tax=Allacma fusca TaxID=39272 RepID=A0A8J2K1G8_9HEXA|nr:unnamed protein product [Allacma fusca]